MHALAVLAESRGSILMFGAVAKERHAESTDEASRAEHHHAPCYCSTRHYWNRVAQHSLEHHHVKQVSKHNVQGRNGTRTLNITNTTYRGTVWTLPQAAREARSASLHAVLFAAVLFAALPHVCCYTVALQRMVLNATYM